MRQKNIDVYLKPIFKNKHEKFYQKLELWKSKAKQALLTQYPCLVWICLSILLK